MTKAKLKYAGLILLIIMMGLLSRKVQVIPVATGDALWAMMIFFILRFLFINVSIRTIVLFSLLICCLVEVSQLYQEEWINNLRQTILGRLILGQGFLWSDLLAYAVGIFVGCLIELGLQKKIKALNVS
ncbi:DUF2809 domain-containing protein [Pedobacter frigoris]|uniref:ribosomal maturation YjgA family protein n=1 Tax=Pedobacter frigoris TaxID=2571272 RepID=UPI00292D2607|nr:DUF2809 domain-containing protein [Pedobacter frigoris]